MGSEAAIKARTKLKLQAQERVMKGEVLSNDEVEVIIDRALEEERAGWKKLDTLTESALRLAGTHGHWDSTMQHGNGCPVCIEARKLGKEIETVRTDLKRFLP